MKFKKEILTEGVYLVSTENGRQKKKITKEDLQHWAKTHDKMRQNGLNIPAPLAHAENEIPTKVKQGQDGTLPRSDLNAGWWEKLWVEDGSDGISLWGEVNVPDPEIAKKVQNGTIKETSIYSRPKYQDGDSNTWDDALMHVALVTHPIESNQQSFTPNEGLAVSMSHKTDTVMSDSEGLTDETGGERNINEVLKKLKDVAQIALPEGTTSDSLVDNLMAALLQKEISESDVNSEGTVDKPGDGSVEQPAPIAMSLTPDQIEAITMANIPNPDTGKPFTKHELEQAIKVDSQSSVESQTIMAELAAHKQGNKALVNHISNQHKTDLNSRATVLMSQGKLTQAHYESNVKPQIESFQMSFTPEGQPVSQAVEQVIEALEAQPAPAALGTIEGGPAHQNLPPNVAAALTMSQGGNPAASSYVTEPNPMESDEPLSDEAAQQYADSFLVNTGFANTPAITTS